MTRHARNCTAGAVYTYHEKRKDAAASGYGTNTQRVGKDSVKDFDCCCLTLQPCRNPVITKDGYLFDKEAILEYVLTKKKEYARKLKEYEKQKQQEEEQSNEKSANEELQKLQKFLKGEKNIVSRSQIAAKESGSSVSNMSNGKDKMLPSFWIPSKTPEAKETILQKPDKTIYCPLSGKPLKIKDLIPVKFTEVKDPDDKKSLIVKQARYMCPITHDILSNSVPCAVIRTTGDVITMECVEKIIRKDWINPLDSTELTEADIIPLQRGGTGYSAVNDGLEGKHERPVLQA
ncbi:nitric oxide synthase-interacting protein homolog [Bombus vosnesenskii]|uniref:Nitric oxide synthase-interacting protein homolog n=3 Tax=Pyrobombus TaxID=144703 RepID=A0A6J3KWQ6_9HYME|nr:nitric oxide synthase-interacting protein homolog [Bombus impatiens]XP_033197256.1 nitric oxide synthase-interacting protein homolog [Bombus vancouverensis nearcticus]XP_033312389.1 nitric oxide synthase-interacting protein homolog [Bombus bifarius]XP_033356571.1 nitric oxide synthase-interacting protein homolog [Bombus vosnesenskii]